MATLRDLPGQEFQLRVTFDSSNYVQILLWLPKTFISGEAPTIPSGSRFRVGGRFGEVVFINAEVVPRDRLKNWEYVCDFSLPTGGYHLGAALYFQPYLAKKQDFAPLEMQVDDSTRVNVLDYVEFVGSDVHQIHYQYLVLSGSAVKFSSIGGSAATIDALEVGVSTISLRAFHANLGISLDIPGTVTVVQEPLRLVTRFGTLELLRVHADEDPFLVPVDVAVHFAGGVKPYTFNRPTYLSGLRALVGYRGLNPGRFPRDGQAVVFTLQGAPAGEGEIVWAVDDAAGGRASGTQEVLIMENYAPRVQVVPETINIQPNGRLDLDFTNVFFDNVGWTIEIFIQGNISIVDLGGDKWNPASKTPTLVAEESGHGYINLRARDTSHNALSEEVRILVRIFDPPTRTFDSPLVLPIQRVGSRFVLSYSDYFEQSEPPPFYVLDGFTRDTLQLAQQNSEGVEFYITSAGDAEIDFSADGIVPFQIQFPISFEGRRRQLPVLAERIAFKIQEVSVQVEIRLANPVPSPKGRVNFTVAEAAESATNKIELNREYSSYSVSGTSVSGEEQVQVPIGSVFRIGDGEERYEVIATGEGEVGDLIPLPTITYSQSDFFRWHLIRNAGPSLPGSPKIFMLDFTKRLWILDTITQELSFAADLNLSFPSHHIHSFDVYYHSVPRLQQDGSFNDEGDQKWYLAFLTQGYQGNDNRIRLRFLSMDFTRAPTLDVLLPRTYQGKIVGGVFWGEFWERKLYIFGTMSLVIFNNPEYEPTPRIYIYWVENNPSVQEWFHHRLGLFWDGNTRRHIPAFDIFTWSSATRFYIRGQGSSSIYAFFQSVNIEKHRLRRIRPDTLIDVGSLPDDSEWMRVWLPPRAAITFGNTWDNELYVDPIFTISRVTTLSVSYSGIGTMYHFALDQGIKYNNQVELTLFDSHVRDRMYLPGGGEIGFDQSKSDDDDRYVLTGRQIFSNVVHFFPLLREDLAAGTKIAFVRTYGLGTAFPILLAFSGDFSGEYLYEADGVVAYFLASQVDFEITVDSQIAFDAVVYRVISVVPRFARGHVFLYRLSLVRVESFQPSLEEPV